MTTPIEVRHLRGGLWTRLGQTSINPSAVPAQLSETKKKSVRAKKVKKAKK